MMTLKILTNSVLTETLKQLFCKIRNYLWFVNSTEIHSQELVIWITVIVGYVVPLFGHLWKWSLSMLPNGIS